MKQKKVCEILAKLESENEVNSIRIDGIYLWPLIRQCIWKQLLIDDQIGSRAKNTAYKINKALRFLQNFKNRTQSEFSDDTSTLFISQTENLQYFPHAGLWFDRIIDTLYFLEKQQTQAAKCYQGFQERNVNPFFLGYQMRPENIFFYPNLTAILPTVLDLFRQAGISNATAKSSFKNSFKKFLKWYVYLQKLVQRRQNVKRIYLSCWYIPENMGLIAAAKKLNITTVDVQHGKQGRYHGMYSHWTSLPSDGYQMMPPWFWCWGTPTLNNLQSQFRKHSAHKAFIGGFPWPDYFKKYLSIENTSSPEKTKKVILFTLQPRLTSNIKPIPDFIISYLKSEKSDDELFIFRAHPNYPSSTQYILKRLAGIPKTHFRMNDGKEDFYSELQKCTHHVTAFSSSCFEAEMFNVPTLLFGPESKSLYNDEINLGRFSWTKGCAKELKLWLEKQPIPNKNKAQPYIETSMALAAKHLKAFRQSQTSY